MNVLDAIKRFILLLTILSPVGADVEHDNDTEYCYDQGNPEGILLARQLLEAVEAPNADIYVQSVVELKDAKLIKHEYTLRSKNLSSVKILDNESNCLEVIRK